MANREHLQILNAGIDAWNEWRLKNPEIKPDLEKADLSCMNLREVNLSKATLIDVDFQASDLTGADLSEAVLAGSRFWEADLTNANFSGANLESTLFGDTLCAGANFSGAPLRHASLSTSNFTNANFSNCEIYGIAAWDVGLEGAIQSNLTIVPVYSDVPVITVDNLEVAQFINLLITNRKIRDVITSITSKAVLILGRFTPERKAVLDALRDELREHGYLPLLLDFDIPEGRDMTETVTLLARMARFIVADLTEPSSVPKELEAIIPTLAVPVQPLIEGSSRPYSMFSDYWKYDWVLDVHRYNELSELLTSINESVIEPAENKIKELERKRQRINTD